MSPVTESEFPAPSPAPIPATLGPFRIVRTLGSGAMGVVYLGERTEQFQQRVAIKMLHPHVSMLVGEHALHHEEKVLISMDHEAIVRLLDTGESNGIHYIVMEYVDGVPLDRYCGESSASLGQRLTLLLQVARAIDYAHRRLVIHADLKPENILITPEGKPRILDFGVSILVDGGTQSEAVSERYTPAFASPEQIANGRVTPATDIYSLGTIATTLLLQDGVEGRRTSRDMNAILLKATSPAPEDRYATMGAFADDMEAALEHRPVAARNGNQVYRLGRWIRGRRTTAAMLLLLAVVLVASVTGVVVQTIRAARQRRLAQTRLHDLVRLTGVLEGELYDSVTPLPHATPAKLALIHGATQTLDALAADDTNDAVLTLAIAQQYGRLAKLQMTGSEPAAAQQARDDAGKAIRLLSRVPHADPRYAEAQREAAELTQLGHRIPPR